MSGIVELADALKEVSALAFDLAQRVLELYTKKGGKP